MEEVAEVRIVGASPIRCPWCHDELCIAPGEWVACAACLARHHSECWQEATACASCRERASLTASAPLRTVFLRAEGPAHWRDVERRVRARKRRWIVGTLAAGLAVANALQLLLVLVADWTTRPAIAPFIFSIF